MDAMDAEEMIGKTLREVVPQFADQVEPLYRQVLSTGQPILNREVSGPSSRDPDRTTHFIVNYFPVQVKDDDVIGVGVVALDLTELKEAQEREAVFAQILEESRNEIYIFDAETMLFRKVNRGARENLGYSAKELSRMTPLDLKPEHTESSFAELVEPLIRGSQDQVRFETVHRRKDGTRYPVDVHLQLSTAGEQPVFVALIVDSTERKKAEQELVAARDAAEHANQAKSQFLTVMSHELRTPLNAIIGYEDLLEAGVAGPLTDKQVEHLRRIKNGAEQLLSLISQILSLARIESGKEEVDYHSIDVANLASEVTSLMEGLAEQKGLSMSATLPDDEVRTRTDPGKVRQILLNLVGNAVKFTEEGEVEISLEQQGDQAVFRIRDTGPGVPDEYHEKMFEPFIQVDLSNTRKHGGTGLGLAVSRELARLLGGDLSVESELGAGSTFILTLPVS